MAKTNQEKLAAAVALVAKLTGLINAEAILNNVEAGNVVVFGFGRGEKRRELEGTVVAVKDDEKQGKLARIQTGEGFDAQFFSVRVADITENKSVVADETPAPDGDEAPASEDPLANA